MPRKIAILQSNYIPWKGYFDLINLVDEFIFYDDAQFTNNDWRNRNRIKTQDGPQWLTIPIAHHMGQKIRETQVSGSGWAAKHWKTLLQNYSKARHFAAVRDRLEPLYMSNRETSLSRINHSFIKTMCEILGIKTKLSWSMDYELKGGKTERLVNLCKAAGGGEYLSGPAAKAYLEEDRFREAGITLKFMDYSGYPEYAQLFPPFEHSVSALDLIFNEGPEAPKFMKSFITAETQR
jgi:hypothetical protein